MADEKTFTESEHLAILGDRVATETAELTAQVAQLQAEVAALQTANDTLEAAKIAAEQAREAAVTELAEFKDETEKAAARAQVRAERAKKVSDLVGDKFEVTAERAERYAAMDEAEFAAFVADLEDVAPKPGSTPPPAREGASFSGSPAQPPAAGEPTGQSNARALLALGL